MSEKTADRICTFLGVLGSIFFMTLLFAGSGLDSEQGWEIALLIVIFSAVGCYGCVRLAEFVHDISK